MASSTTDKAIKLGKEFHTTLKGRYEFIHTYQVFAGKIPTREKKKKQLSRKSFFYAFL